MELAEYVNNLLKEFADTSEDIVPPHKIIIILDAEGKVVSSIFEY